MPCRDRIKLKPLGNDTQQSPQVHHPYERKSTLSFSIRNQCLGRGAGRRSGFVLAYRFSCSKGIGRLTKTVTLVLSVGFMIDSTGNGPRSTAARVLQRDYKQSSLSEELAGP